MVEFFKVDTLAAAQGKLECYAALHRQAGIRGYACSPTKSYIDGGRSYYAEINLMLGGGVIRPNVAMGVGATPLEAAVDGYRKAVPLDDMMAALYLECELYLLSETIRVYGKLEAALAELAKVALTAFDLFPCRCREIYTGLPGNACEDCMNQRHVLQMDTTPLQDIAYP